eukprot:13606850-Ditylum_brightwellii.AAC.1
MNLLRVNEEGDKMSEEETKLRVLTEMVMGMTVTATSMMVMDMAPLDVQLLRNPTYVAAYIQK